MCTNPSLPLLQVTVAVVNIVSNVVTASDSDESSGDEIMLDQSENLLNILTDFEEQIERATESGQNIAPVVESNIIFTTTNVPPQTNRDISFAVTSSNNDGNEDGGFNDVDVGLKKDANSDKFEVRTSISLPASIFHESNSKYSALNLTLYIHLNSKDISFERCNCQGNATMR